MAKVTQVQPAGIIVTMEIPLEELTMLKTALDITQFNADSKDESQTKATEYVTNSFYPLIKEVVEDLTNGTRSNS